MPLFSFEGARPNIHPDAWIAPTATLIGDVTVEADASIWYGAVIRADFGPVIIREGANVQDNSVIHVGEGGCEIGRGATIGHSCVVHDCMVGEHAVIGNSATIQDKAQIGARTLVAAGALVAPRTEVPDETLAMGSPAKKFTPLTEAARGWIDYNGEIYADLARRHKASVKPVDD